jgi:hypothetical protein
MFSHFLCLAVRQPDAAFPLVACVVLMLMLFVGLALGAISYACNSRWFNWPLIALIVAFLIYAIVVYFMHGSGLAFVAWCGLAAGTSAGSTGGGTAG